MVALALPLMVRELLTGNPYAVYVMTIGAFFITAFAVFSGIMTGVSKLFEVVFTIMVYCSINSTPLVDFTGAVPGSRELGITGFEAAASLIIVFLAFLGRKREISHFS